MGVGTIHLKGRKARPWLELCRCETQRTYLLHQVRRLQRAHDSPLETVCDTVPTDGFYDIHRARMHGEGLYRVYELLYPRDERRISEQVLAIAGMEGAATLWLDHGCWRGKRPAFNLCCSQSESEIIVNWLRRLGLHCLPSLTSGNGRLVVVNPGYINSFTKTLRPWVHASMRHTLRPPVR